MQRWKANIIKKKKIVNNKKKLGTSKAVTDIMKCWKLVLSGNVLCIDPSVGSNSSMPGYAIYQKGYFIENGIIEVQNPNKDISYRLQEIAKALRDEFQRVDVLVIEDIPPFRAGKGFAHGSSKSHASLLKSVGCILGAVDAKYVVNMHPRAWQRWVDERYIKDDHVDARYIGIAAVAMAKLIKEDVEREKE